jgi:hypothetical protein
MRYAHVKRYVPEAIGFAKTCSTPEAVARAAVGRYRDLLDGHPLTVNAT